MKDNESEIQEVADTIRRGSIRITGILEGEEKRRGLESISRPIVDENVPDLRNELELGIQEVNRAPNDLKRKRPSPRHGVVNRSDINDKDRIPRAAGGKKTVTYKEKPTRLSSDFSARTCQATKGWHRIFRLLREGNHQPTITCPATLSFRCKGEIRTVPGIPQLREFSATGPALREILKGVSTPTIKSQKANTELGA